MWAWDNSCAWIPSTHLSAALQIGSDVGFRSLCMDVTSSVTTLDPNQNCSISFDGSASGIAQSLACKMKRGKVQRDCTVLILQKEHVCSFSSFWLGILK